VGVGSDAVMLVVADGLVDDWWSDHLTICQYRTIRVDFVYGREWRCGYDRCAKIIFETAEGFSKVTE
jgi:hypothetical protein